ncbi:hypothetical protein [Salinibacterium sp. ZJ450]|uniref:hypothetical protein n=1 Tax=Salinibacterium sp. ZJ450 TaxID=2708338 RepID=UPI00141F4B79|nr:hypothetical protein [Salinibacterium sp. ZJ450]
MAHLTQTYDDRKLQAALMKIRPNLNLEDGRVTEIELEPEYANSARRVLTLTIDFPLTREELDGVLEAAK